MKVIDLIYIIFLVGIVINLYKSGHTFLHWLMETGFFAYTLKAIILSCLIIGGIGYLKEYFDEVKTFLEYQLF